MRNNVESGIRLMPMQLSQFIMIENISDAESPVCCRIRNIFGQVIPAIRQSGIYCLRIAHDRP